VLFLDGYGMTIKEPPSSAGRHMQPVLIQQMDQSTNVMRLEFDGPEDHVPVGFDMVGALIPALWLRSCGFRGFNRPHPGSWHWGEGHLGQPEAKGAEGARYAELDGAVAPSARMK
jgi:hypothetical protein